MRRVAIIAIGLALALAGCKSKSDIRPTKLQTHENFQLVLERDQAVHLLGILQKSEKGGGGTTHHQIYLQEIRILDLDWRLGRLPYNTYHTRRRDMLTDVRAEVERQLVHGWCSQMEYDHADLLVLRERMLIKDIERATYEAHKEAYRERLMASATRGARNEAAAQAQANKALVDFDTEMREW